MTESTFDLFGICSDLAPIILSLDRDETDAYNIRLTHNDRCEAPSAIRALTVSDLVGLLPSGSSWRGAVGWRSFFGLPVTLKEFRLYAFGTIEILPHATRGAFPTAQLLVFPESSGGLLEAIKRVQESLPSTSSKSLVTFGWRGVVASDSARPPEHIAFERQVLTTAQSEIGDGSAFLFRTLLLAETELRLPGHPAPLLFAQLRTPLKLRHDVSHWLLVTAPPLKNQFSWIVRNWLNAQKAI